MTEDTTLQKIENVPLDPAIEDMVSAGVFYGRKKSKTNPKMRKFIFGNRGGMEIIDLHRTEEALGVACDFITEKARGGAVVLFVGTQATAQAAVIEVAQSLNAPQVTNRWLGGTLTNFGTISERIRRFKQLNDDFKSGALDKYTKKERVEFDKEMKRLETLIGGIASLDRVPDVLVVIDPMMHEDAIREATRLKIPVVALANTDANPDAVPFLVPGSTTSTISIRWFLSKIADAVRAGRTGAPAVAVEQTS